MADSPIYIHADTLGLPSSKAPHPPVVAVGLASWQPDGSLTVWASLVKQPAALVHAPSSKGALRANGIPPEDIINAKRSPGSLMNALALRLRGRELRGFNLPFVRACFDCRPWLEGHTVGATWGMDVMGLAARRWGSGARISFRKALQGAMEERADVSPRTVLRGGKLGQATVHSLGVGRKVAQIAKLGKVLEAGRGS